MSKDNGRMKGQGLVLVTGKKGSGKSHFVTKEIKCIVDNFPEHKVYADIDGLNIDGVEKSPENWLDAPKNCTIIYDEAQRLPWADNSNTKINSDERVREMTMIRHENKNIVLITQDPTFIHSALRKLVDVHYHISHPFKDGKPKVFKFFGAVSQIDDKGNYKSQSQEEFTHHLTDDISKLYKSVDDGASHDQKRKIPKKIIYMGIFILILIFTLIPLGIIGIKIVGGFILGAEERGAESIREANEQIGIAPDKMNDDWNNRSAVSGFTDNQPNSRNYVNPELHKKYLLEYTVEVANDPVVLPASVVAMNGKCKAYNQYGDLLNIPNKQCLEMLSEVGRIPKRRDIYSRTGDSQTSVSDVYSEYRESEFKEDQTQNQQAQSTENLPIERSKTQPTANPF